MKILILKPSSLGDVVQALPVLRLLKAQDRTREIFWWISDDLAPLLREDPDLTGLFLFHRRRWGSPRHWGEVISSIREIRAHEFDWVIDLQGLARSAIVAWFANAKLTVGVEDWREGAPALYDLGVRRPSPLTHAVDWYLEVLPPLQVPVHWNFEWLAPHAEAAEQVRRKWNPAPGLWLTIVPGARWKNKRWPVEYFAELVRQLARAHDYLNFAILGTRADTELAWTICQAAPDRSVDLTGQTSLPEMVEWIRLSDGLVTNDTGPMHIGAALGKRIVSLFGPTEPRRTGPYGQSEESFRSALPCAPCLKPWCQYEKPIECLRLIRPEQVRLKVEEVLSV